MDSKEMFENLDYEGIRSFVELKKEEGLHLDFKGVTDASLSQKDDRKNLAKALSGFANSAGGVIVWGVDARKGEDGLDCARALKPIASPEKLVARLGELSGDGVEPKVAGVAHRAISQPDGMGFVVTYVPESNAGPHMAKLGEDRYYKRVAGNFYVMEHYDIADMFGRRRRPQLEVVYRVVARSLAAKAVISLRNVGRATAKAPFLAFNTSSGLRRDLYGLDGNRSEGLPYLKHGAHGMPWAYGAGMDVAIHPGVTLDVAVISLGFNERGECLTSDEIVSYVIACEDQPLEQATLVIPLKELR